MHDWYSKAQEVTPLLSPCRIRALHMTRREAAKNIHNMREYGKKVTSSRDAAVRALQNAGILSTDGKVAEPYKALLDASS